MSRHTKTKKGSSRPHSRRRMKDVAQGLMGQEDIHFRAQELAYDAMGAPSQVEWLRLVVRAVVLDPDCTDAYRMLAELIIDPEEHLEAMQRIVQRASDAIGPDYFAQNKGWFWGVLETRPYMRARLELAMSLKRLGRVDEAMTEMEGMLDLNPNDNQGIRYLLLGLYLEKSRLDDVKKLFVKYEEEASAEFAWAALLLAILQKDDALAEETLKGAREVNKHVEGYLTGSRRMPKRLPDLMGFGDVNEAIVTVEEIGKAWKQQPAAVRWLKEHKLSRPRKAKHSP